MSAMLTISSVAAHMLGTKGIPQSAATGIKTGETGVHKLADHVRQGHAVGVVEMEGEGVVARYG